MVWPSVKRTDEPVTVSAIVVVPDELSLVDVHRDHKKAYSEVDDEIASETSETQSDTSAVSESSFESSPAAQRDDGEPTGSVTLTENKKQNLKIPLCCLTLPVGRTSLLLAHLATLHRLRIKDTRILVHNSHAEAVKEHLYCVGGKKLKGTSVIPVNSTTLLEALREARCGELQGLRNDFYLILADSFIWESENHLRNLLAAHQSGSAENPRLLFTRFLAEVPFNESLEEEQKSDTAGRKLSRYLLATRAFPNHLYIVDSMTQQLMCNFYQATSHVAITGDMLGGEPGARRLRVLSRFVHTGIEVFSIHLFDYLKENFDLLYLIPDLVDAIVTDKLQLRAIHLYTPPATFASNAPPAFRISTFSSLYLFQEALRNTAPERPFPWNASDYTAPSITCAPSSFLGVNVTLGHDVEIKESLVFDNAVLGDRSRCFRSALLPNSSVPADALLEQVTVAPYSTVANSSSLYVDQGIHFDALSAAPFSPKEMTLQEFVSDEELVSSTCGASEDDSVSLCSEAQLEASDVPTKRVADAPSSTPFETEVYALALDALLQPDVLEHKLLEIKSYRLACHERLGACFRPCARALLDALASRMEASSWLTAETVEACRGDELLAAFLHSSDPNGESDLLDALYLFATSRKTVPKVNTSNMDADEIDDARPSSAPESLVQRNPFLDASLFCKLLSVFWELDLLSDNTLFAWCRSAPPPFHAALQSFAHALAQHQNAAA